jgi:TatD DNase family protein
MLAAATEAGVTRIICVGTTLEDSALAVNFANGYQNIWASIGLHPHEAGRYVGDHAALDQFAELATKPKVVAVGECGLDYYYNHSKKDDQLTILRSQIELALASDLPMIFHIRDAFSDFWPVFDSYQGVKGVVHSFSATGRELEEILSRNLYVGLNGIMTFTKSADQLTAAKAVPLERLLLETDAPFLTPVPYRGKICEPKHVRVTAEFLAHLRGQTIDELARQTTKNARELFGLQGEL